MPQSGRIKELLLEPRGDFGSLSGTKRTSIWCQHSPVRRNRTLSSQSGKGWQGTSIAAGPASPSRVALFQPYGTEQQPSWGSGTETQPLLGQKKSLAGKMWKTEQETSLFGVPAGWSSSLT